MNKKWRGFRTDGIPVVFVEEKGVPVRLLHPQFSQKVRLHSPDGFNWGYGGSGPSQLALALLLDAGISPDEAARLHQRFKWRFISGLPDSWVFEEEALYMWVLAQPEYLASVAIANDAPDVDPTLPNGKPGMEPEVPDVT